MQEPLTVYVPEEIRLMLNRTRAELSRDLRLTLHADLLLAGKALVPARPPNLPASLV